MGASNEKTADLTYTTVNRPVREVRFNKRGWQSFSKMAQTGKVAVIVVFAE